MHARLQRSCCVVQLRVQAAAPPELGVAVAVIAACPAATQALWHVMTCVSQPVTQAVDACEDINGVGTSGTGWTCPGITTCASCIRSAAKAVESARAASRIASCRRYLIEPSACAGHVLQSRSIINATAMRQLVMMAKKPLRQFGCCPWRGCDKVKTSMAYLKVRHAVALHNH